MENMQQPSLREEEEESLPVVNYTYTAEDESQDKDNNTFTTSVTHLTIDPSVKCIRDGFSRGCGSLHSIAIAQGSALETVAANAFQSCSSLAEIASFPSGLGRIGSKAFQGCKSLVEVDLSVTKLTLIDYETFRQCESLRKVSVPPTLETIGEGAFSDCASLVEFQFPDANSQLQTIGAMAFASCSSLVEMKLPHGLLRIEKYAFFECPLKSIAIPSTVESIGDYAFICCASLTRVHIPKGNLKKIGSDVFSYCASLAEIDLSLGGFSAIESRTFMDCDSLRSISIPSKLETIKSEAFIGCRLLCQVHLPRSLRRIGEKVFCGCNSLAEITLPEFLTVIEAKAFWGCSSLRMISIPSSVEAICDEAFLDCTWLDEVMFHRGLIWIGERAFANCKDLGAIALPSGLEVINREAFQGCNSLVGVQIPDDSLVALGDLCFTGCKSLVTVSVPTIVFHQMADKAFAGGPKLYNRTGNQPIVERFAHLPLHQLCYSQTPTDSHQLLQELFNSSSSVFLNDAYGMTPFHIIATSEHLNPSLLRSLLDDWRLPVSFLNHKDHHGKTMLDYSLQHPSNKVIPLIQLVLDRAIVRIVSQWGQTATRESDLSDYLGRIERVNPGKEVVWFEPGKSYTASKVTKEERVMDFYAKVGYCIRVEVTSLLEQALWKMRMRNVQKEEFEDELEFRSECRFQSGAEVVVENVFGYLWHGEGSGYLWRGETRECTALTMFPLFTPTSECAGRVFVD